jgi:transposase
VRRNKNDAVDAEAICEAVGRPNMGFVAVREVEDQAELMRHRTRELLVGNRTRMLNALRGHLAEIGVVAPQGAQHAYGLKRLLTAGHDDSGEIVVPDSVRTALAPLAKQIDAIDEEIEAIDGQIKAQVKGDDLARRLATIPSIGPITASALVATVRYPSAFASGRDLAAFIGLTPRQNSSGGKERLGSITKMGDRYLRKLLVVGALRGARPSQGSQRRSARLGRPADGAQAGSIQVQADRGRIRQQSRAHRLRADDARRRIRRATCRGLKKRAAEKGISPSAIRDRR